MKEHYGLTDAQIITLSKSGIGTKELFHAAKEFSAGPTDLAPVSKISLLHFIDKHGDFSESRNSLDRIALAVYENLDKKSKLEVMNYLDDMEDE